MMPSSKDDQNAITRARALAEAEGRALAILGLPQGASKDEIRAAFRRLAAETHPDKHPDRPDSTVRFRRVLAAYRFLSGEDTDPAGVPDIDRTAEPERDPARSGTFDTSNEWGMFLWWKDRFLSPFMAPSPDDEPEEKE